MLVDAANALLQRYRYAVADTCQAKAVFNAHLTGPSDEYKAAREMLEKYLKAENLALIACQDAMMDCGCRDRECGRAESLGEAQRDRQLDYAEEMGREDA